MTWPWERSVLARILFVLVGLLSSALLVLNLAMGGFLADAQLEEAANHLQIQSLLAARTLEDPLGAYSHELEERHEDDDDDHHHHRKHEESSVSTDRLSDWAGSFTSRSGSGVSIFDSRGSVLAGLSSGLTQAEAEAAQEGRPHHRWTEDSVIATAPIMRRDHLLGVVRLQASRGEATQRSRAISMRLALVSLVSLLLAVTAAIWLSRRLVKPLKQLERSALRVAEGEWSQSVEVGGQDELASLSRAFSTMLSELRRMMQGQRQFVSDASHELRTPLTRMKLRTEALMDGALEEPETARKFLAEIDGEVDRMTELTRALLEISKFDEGKAVNQTTADPTEAIRRVCLSLEPLARQRKITLSQSLEEALPPLAVSPRSLQLIVENLLENGLKYTPEEGNVELKVERASKGVKIDVSDNGPGIAAEHHDRLFERFYRADASRTRSGTGLGLALVKAAAESAGGTVAVESKVGEGTRFSVFLPPQ